MLGDVDANPRMVDCTCGLTDVAQRATIDESCENLAIDGLRTLVIAQKGLT